MCYVTIRDSRTSQTSPKKQVSGKIYSPCDFWLFLAIRRELRRRQFSSDEEVTNVIQVFLKGQSANEFEKTIIMKWEEQM